MAFASCNACFYRCRVADSLAGKLIRCPKCQNVVQVKDAVDPVPALRDLRSDLSEPVADQPAEVVDEDPAIYYIGKMIDRRGPVTMSQIRMLVRWDLINQNLMLSDVTGTRRTTIAEYLKHGGWERKKSNRPIPGNSAVAPVARRLPPVIRRPSAPAPPAESNFEEDAAEVDTYGQSLMPDEFRQLLDRAVELERNAKTVIIERPMAADETPEYVPSVGARFIRRAFFSDAYRFICIIMLANATVFSIFSCATMGMFFKHLLRICVSVFIPFDTTGANIEGEPLLLAGLAFVFVCGQLILPVWLLIRDDCVPWHGIAATALGVMVGLAMKPTWLPSIFMMIRGAGVLSGFTVAATTFWLISKAKQPEISLRLSVAAGLTAAFSVIMCTVDVTQLLLVTMSELSPAVSGSTLHVGVLAVSMYVAALAVPITLLSFVYPEAPESVQRFLTQRLITAAILGVVGAIGLLWFAFPPKSDFVNAPLMMFPLMTGNMVLITIPPLMWILQPAYSLPRNSGL